MKRNYQTEIENLIDTIKHIIADNHVQINDISVSALQKIASYKDFVPEVKADKTQTVKEQARQSARDKAIKATARLELAFDDLRTTIFDWLSEPLPQNFADIISVHHGMDLKLSLAELRSLTRLAAGNYYGMKVISEIGARDFYVDIPFTNADTIIKQIDGAEGDSRVAITAYSGIQTPWLNDVDLFYQSFADGFLDRTQSQLVTLEKTLRDSLSEESPLIVSESEKIAKLFEDAKSEQERLNSMCNAILNGGISETRLQAYDSNLYKMAKEALAKEASEQAQKAKEAMLKATAEAGKATMANAKAQADVAKLNNNASARMR